MRDTRPLGKRAEVAEYMGVPVRTLDRWATRDYGPPYIRVGKHSRYRWSDVDRWLDQQAKGGQVAS
jgi:excisionase family DNA binding protein